MKTETITEITPIVIAIADNDMAALKSASVFLSRSVLERSFMIRVNSFS